MNPSVREILDAWLAGDHATLEAIRDRKTALSIYADTILAEQASWQAPWDHSAAYLKLKLALDDLSQDADLLNVMFRLAITIAVKVNHLDDARRMLRVMKQTQTAALYAPLRANCAIAESDIAWYTGDHGACFEALTRGLALSPPGTLLWYVVKIRRILRAMTFEQLAQAKQDLQDLQPIEVQRWLMPMPYPLLELSLLVKFGQYEDALTKLGALQSAPARDPQLLELEIFLLLKTRQIVPARQKIAAHRDVLTRNSLALLRAQEALLCHDYDTTRRQLEIALSGEPNIEAFLVKPRLRMFAQLELCLGHAPDARRLLEMLDPGGASEIYTLEWIRLNLLEGQFERARELYLSGSKKIPLAALLDGLRDAPEISTREVARLLGPQEDAARGTAGPAPHSQSPKPRAAPPLSLLGRSPEIEALRATLPRLAASRDAVLITGEAGTEKDLLAQLLHKQSPWADAPFVRMQCHGISDALIESELFGFSRQHQARPGESETAPGLPPGFYGSGISGDGLFIAAGKGTLLLENIEALSPRLQTALLGALKQGSIQPLGGKKRRPFQARILASANETLAHLLDAGEFSAELCALLRTRQLHLPPLRKRRQDILPLAEHYLKEASAEISREIAPGLAAKLEAHAWPGNERELRAAIERLALISGERRQLTAEMFDPVEPPPPGLALSKSSPRSSPAASMPMRKRELLSIFKRYPELSRRDVIRMLKCAPMTADSALRALEAEGHIRRVKTQTRKRTAYFSAARPKR